VGILSVAWDTFFINWTIQYMIKPTSICILGKVYSIIYCADPLDVDPEGKEPNFGWMDPWRAEIRVYDSPCDGDVWDTLIHEVLHIIIQELQLTLKNEEQIVHLLAVGLSDCFIRNNLIR
jgi:hypothetical protein